ncbi:glycosyltransferase [Mucilaginibacter sp. McL0603]|uniref:glycosyltransferase n=1 Tax=Mucilaginibacter sp. McL0603 TaxID=3415670 RepID=UPI003CF30F3C
MRDKLYLPLVSVVFTSYNHREYLQQALDSLVDQTYKNIEIIVVDDNSTDGSREILLSYKDIPNIQLHLLDKNTGSYVKASNYGAGFAKGDYLMFAQCDDFAVPEQIEMLMNAFFNNTTVGVVFSKSNMVDENGNVYSDDYVGREKSFRERCINNTIIQGNQMREFLSFACVIPNLSAAIIKKELFVSHGGLSTQYLVAADWAFWLTLSENTDFYYITVPLNNFRQHSTTIRSKIKLATQVVEVYSIFYEHIRKYRLVGENKRRMQIGAASVWFWYFLENKLPWILSFPLLLRKTFRFEKFNLYYLMAGFFKHLNEHSVKVK